MAETVEFDLIHEYSIYKDGITVETILKYGDRIVIFEAKVDTGSTYCVFERGRGEALGLEITAYLYNSARRRAVSAPSDTN